MRSELLKIGFEIEGEFHPDFMNEIVAIGGVMKHDGSVRCNHSGLQAKEYNSPVIPLTREGLKLCDKIFATFKKARSLGQYYANDSAGFHIHTSYAPISPPELVSHLFYRTYMQNLQIAFPDVIPNRITGQYCKAVESDEEIWRGGSRYRAINYQPALSRHGTIEFRIFPSNMPDIMEEYVHFTIKQIKEFLHDDHQINFDTEIYLQKSFVRSYSETAKLKPYTQEICVN